MGSVIELMDCEIDSHESIFGSHPYSQRIRGLVRTVGNTNLKNRLALSYMLLLKRIVRLRYKGILPDNWIPILNRTVELIFIGATCYESAEGLESDSWIKAISNINKRRPILTMFSNMKDLN